LSAESALVFSLVTGTLATVLLGYYGNSLAAFFGVFTIAFYIGIYTLWLKRSTPYNIVIGGAAGATAPLIGWAAATGSISWGAFFMFLIIFLWTPPHFWALALCVKDEYAEASVPMLPVVKGVAHTQKQIFLYTLIMLPFTIALFFTGDCGYFYLTASILLGAIFLQRAYALYQHASDSNAWRLFGYSIVYLLTLFLVIMLDLQVQKWFAFTVGPFA
jgi:protoheme IX farnesyltransferase